MGVGMTTATGNALDGVTIGSRSAMVARVAVRRAANTHAVIENGQGVEVFFVLENDWRSALLGKILGFRSLRQDWNSYGSSPPSESAIRQAVRFVALMENQDPRPRVLPVSGGGIQFEWSCGTRELEVEVLENGNVEFLKVPDRESVGEEGNIGSLDRIEIEKLYSWLTHTEI
jgi:hypothetical protein